MTDYLVTGYPLPGEGVVLDVENDGHHLIVDEQAVMTLLQAWTDAPRHGSDVVRESRSTDNGTYVVALYMDEEITIDVWTEYDSGIWDLTSAPFDFEYNEII